MADEPSLATVLAKVEGLGVALGGIQRQLDQVTILPVQVATLAANQSAMERRLEIIEEERSEGPNRNLTRLSIIVVGLIGVAGIILSVLTLAGV